MSVKKHFLKSMLGLLFIMFLMNSSAMSQINSLQLETWTSDIDEAGTDDKLYCKITFSNGSSFEKRVHTDADDWIRNKKERFSLPVTGLDENGVNIATVLAGKTANDIISVRMRHDSGGDKWKCQGIGLFVNGAPLLSRKLDKGIENGESFTVNLRRNGKLDGLGIRVKTGPNGDYWKQANTSDNVYATVRFWTISSIDNLAETLQADSLIGSDWQADSVKLSLVYLPSNLMDPNLETGLIQKTPQDINWFSLRKSGSDNWLLGSAEIFANGDNKPLIANSSINQLVNNEPVVSNITRWSSGTIYGPILGHIGSDAAKIVYRVEREGSYILKVYTAGTYVGQDQDSLNPTGFFEIAGLLPNKAYDFKLFRVQNGAQVELPTTGGSFRTAPAENTPVKFSFGIGSCARNKDDMAQNVWNKIGDRALNPIYDPLNSTNDLRFFVHLGDVFYYYDDVLEAQASGGGDDNDQPSNVSHIATAHLSARQVPSFLNMARKVPVTGVWDDHDFRENDGDAWWASRGGWWGLRSQARDIWLDYFGNPIPFDTSRYGLSGRISYGNADIYIMDGRFNRKEQEPTSLFGQDLINKVLTEIDSRPDRMVFLASGSMWSNDPDPDDLGGLFSPWDPQRYGSSRYWDEHYLFFGELANRIKNGKIKSLVFLSGDIHSFGVKHVNVNINETLWHGEAPIYVPEIISSPLSKEKDMPFVSPPYSYHVNNDPDYPEWAWRTAGQTYGFARLHVNTTTNPWQFSAEFIDSSGYSWYKREYELVNNRLQLKPLTAFIEGPSCVTKGQSGTYTAYPSGGAGLYTYQWLWNSTVLGNGKTVTINPVNTNFTLSLVVTSNGQSVTSTFPVQTCTSGGCPYVFSSTQEGLVADNDILHRTMLKENLGKDITDMYTLKVKPSELDGSYKLQIREMAEDHSYFDAFRFYAVDHDPEMVLGTTENNETVLYRVNEIRLADWIYTEKGSLQYSPGNSIRGEETDVMHIAFPNEVLTKNSVQQLAILIDFNVKFQSLPPKGGGGEMLAYRKDSGPLAKQKANSMKFGIRQNGNVAVIPVDENMDLSDVIINWVSDYEVQSIGIVPISFVSDKTPLPLIKAEHSKLGDVRGRLDQGDKRYAELLPEEYIDLTFESVALKQGLTRDFVFETNGHYFMPKDKEYESANTIPNDFYLGDSYPNPFNPGTTIQYGLPKDADVTLKIYNALGQEIRTLVASRQSAGTKSIYWDGKNDAGATVASGVYIYRIQAGKFTQSKKMMLIK